MNIFKKYEDEFNVINLEENRLVIYTHNGELYTTNCDQIKAIVVPQSFSECTIDLPVYYMKDGNKIILYMTKSGILRNISSIIDCNDEYEFFNFGKLHVKKINKLAVIVEKKYSHILKDVFKKTLFENRALVDNSANQTSDIIDYYYQHFAKNKVFIAIRDWTYYIFMGIVVLFGKNKFICLFKEVLLLLKSKKSTKRKECLDSSDNLDLRINQEKDNFQTAIVQIYESHDKFIAQNEKKECNKQYSDLVTDVSEISNKQGCNCIKGCNKNYCFCRKNKLKCDSNCHNGQPCLN